MEDEHSVKMPVTLKAFLSVRHINEAVSHSHPVTPQMMSSVKDFVFCRNVAGMDYALKILTISLASRRDMSWWALWNNGDSDAKVFRSTLEEEPEFDGDDSVVDAPNFCTAPNICTFFWDLGSSGRKNLADYFRSEEYLTFASHRADSPPTDVAGDFGVNWRW